MMNKKRLSRPAITYEATVEMYRRAERKIEVLGFFGWIAIVLGALSFLGILDGGNDVVLVATGISFILIGIGIVLLCSAAEFFVKATRCKFMVDSDHLRNVQAENN